MYHKVRPVQTTIENYETVEGESIEGKIERIVSNKEPITEAGVQIIHTERSEGVIPAYNPRTDKMELAVEAMDKVATNRTAQRTKGAKGGAKDEGHTEGGEKGENPGTGDNSTTSQSTEN